MQILEPHEGASQGYLPGMSSEERNLRELLWMLLYPRRWERLPSVRRNFLGRNLFVTPYPGCYGLAGHVITLEGSPPRGTFLVPAEKMEVDGSVVYWNGVRARRLGQKQSRIIRAFLDGSAGRAGK